MYSTHTQMHTHRAIQFPRGMYLYLLSATLLVIALQNLLFFTGVKISLFSGGGNAQAAAIVSLDDYQQIVADFNEVNVTLHLYTSPVNDEAVYEISKNDLGFSINYEKMKADANRYDYRKSLIPSGSVIFNDEIAYADYIELDEKVLRDYADKIYGRHNSKSISANISYPLGSDVPI